MHCFYVSFPFLFSVSSTVSLTLTLPPSPPVLASVPVLPPTPEFQIFRALFLCLTCPTYTARTQPNPIPLSPLCPLNTFFLLFFLFTFSLF